MPVATVETLERHISSYLLRWLGIPKSFSSVGLYSFGTKVQLPLKSVTEEFKVTKVRQIIMLRDSQDEKINKAGVRVNTGRKWKAEEAIKQAESRLRHSDIMGTTSGRQGLGLLPATR